MLILTRKPGESLYIGDNVKITIVEIKGHQIRVGIDAPKDLRIYREEIYLQILEENKHAAENLPSGDIGLEQLTQAWTKRASSSGSSEGSSDRDEQAPKKRLSSGIAKVGVKTPTAPQVFVKRKKSQ